MKILLVGHAFAPDRGSEPGFAWNLAWHLSEEHDVWVIAYPEFRDRVEDQLARTPRCRLRMVWVSLPAWCDPFDPAKGQRWVRLHYYFWQWAALKAARRLHTAVSLDLVHHVSLSTVNIPSFLWKLDIPFVWGPIGGGQKAPKSLSKYFGPGWRREVLRNWHIDLLPYSRHLRRAAHGAAAIFATNYETASVLHAAGADRIMMMVDGGVNPDIIPDRLPSRDRGRPVRFLWAGRIEPRKGLALAIESFSAAEDLPIELIVAGDGSERRRCEQLALRSTAVGRIRFVGNVPWRKMPDLFRDVDVFLFTSLQDSFGTVLLEAMAQGLPVIALNHQGPAAFLPDTASVRVAVTTAAQIREGITQAIRTLAVKAELRVAMGYEAWSFARAHTWDWRARHAEELYGRLARKAAHPADSSVLAGHM